MKRHAQSSLVALVLCALLAGCVSLPVPRPAAPDAPPAQRARAAENLRVFGAAWRLVAAKHYDPKLHGVDWPAAAAKFAPLAAAAPDDKALYTVLNDMVGLLDDSHTHALTPVQALERRTRERARTGFSALRIEGRWVINEVLPGSPAALAGVRPGWLLVSRNGTPIGDRLDFRAAEGEVAQWRFLDEHDRPVTLPLVARTLTVGPRQLARELPGGYVCLRFDGFDGRDRRWLSAQLKARRDVRGVILDLRHNPGGETLSLGITIGEFFTRSVDCGDFVSRDGTSHPKSSWQAGSARYAGPVAILIDGATGSAAEIFAAVLSEHGRARLVGRKTAGAVLASRFYRLPGGGELQLSVENYLTPRGRRLESVGVSPDVPSVRTLADVRAGRDPDLDTALRLLRDSEQ